MEIERAIRQIFNLGQTYWQQADSDYASENKKADITLAKFNEKLREITSHLQEEATRHPLPVGWEQTILDAMDEGFSIRRDCGKFANGGLINDDTQLGVEFAISHVQAMQSATTSPQPALEAPEGLMNIAKHMKTVNAFHTATQLKAAEKELNEASDRIVNLVKQNQALAVENERLEAVIKAAQEQEPVYAYRRKGQSAFCTCDKLRYSELSDSELFEAAIFYDHPVPAQSPAVVPDNSLMIFIRDFERRFCRTINDTGANQQARLVLNVARGQAGLPRITPDDLPTWDGKKYVMPKDSKLVANLLSHDRCPSHEPDDQYSAGELS